MSTQKVTSAGASLEVSLHQLKVSGKVVTAVFSIKNVGEAGGKTWYGNMIVTGGEGKRSPILTWMIGDDGKRYLPGLDSEGNCACTVEASGLGTDPGETTFANATFAAPSGDTVTVVLGDLATFKDIKVER